MTRDELVHRLRERAAMARRNAAAYRVSGYVLEPIAHEQRAVAFDLSADDAEQLDDELALLLEAM